jgi:segregation and condensation protein B
VSEQAEPTVHRRDLTDLKAIIEALVLASPEPVSVKHLVKLLDQETPDDIASALEGLRADYDRPGGLQLVELAGGLQIVTRPELHAWERRLVHEHTTRKLSVSALETLAVIAYKQPVTAPEVTEIRGVNAAGVVGTLINASSSGSSVASRWLVGPSCTGPPASSWSGSV